MWWSILIAVLMVYAAMVMASAMNRFFPDPVSTDPDDEVIQASLAFLGTWVESDKDNAPVIDGDVPAKSQLAQQTLRFRARIEAEEEARRGEQ